MLRAEPTNTSTASIDKNHSSANTFLLVTGTERYVWTKVDAVRISPVTTWGSLPGLTSKQRSKTPELHYEAL